MSSRSAALPRQDVIPLHDENPTTLRPLVTRALIIANTAIWLLLQGAGAPQALQGSVLTFGAIPCEVTRACETMGLGGTALLTSMFMHGGWEHLLLNLLFLWVFGNNIEDAMGHRRFVAFYLLTGVVAGLAHVLATPGSALPVVGASGAVSGVMGAYMVLYPRVRVRTWFPPIFLFHLPAWLLLGYWAVLQLLSAIVSFGARIETSESAGIAVWAHLGGFVIGLLLIRPFTRRPLPLAPQTPL